MTDFFQEIRLDQAAGNPHECPRYYGKYRGTVVNNIDPQQMGRVQLIVPDVSAVIPTGWAMPSVPFAYIQSGLFSLPPINSGVWVEFERGDPDFPIWSGGWWGEGQVPVIASAATPATPNIIMQSVGQNTLMLSGDPVKGIVLSAGLIASPSSPQIIITPVAIILKNGACNITITASSVSINNGALAVLP